MFSITLRVAPALMLAFSVCGCASAPKTWTRPDGAPIVSSQLQLDLTACKGEVQKANMAAGDDAPYEIPGLQTPRADIMSGCMAQRGYLAAR